MEEIKKVKIMRTKEGVAATNIRIDIDEFQSKLRIVSRRLLSGANKLNTKDLKEVNKAFDKVLVNLNKFNKEYR